MKRKLPVLYKNKMRKTILHNTKYIISEGSLANTKKKLMFAQSENERSSL